MKLFALLCFLPSMALALSSSVHVATTMRRPSFQEVVKSYGPVLYWPMDDSGGTVARDYGPKGLSGTYKGDPVYNGTGPLNHQGGSVDMDANDYIDVADDDSLDLTTNFTFMQWMKCPAGAVNWPIYVEKGAAVLWRMQRGTNAADWHVWGPGGQFEGRNYTELQDDSWHFWLITDDGSNSHLYVDGAYEESETAESQGANADDFVVGARDGGGDGGEGDYCEVAGFGYVLSLGQIQAIYSSRLWNVAPGDSF